MFDNLDRDFDAFWGECTRDMKRGLSRAEAQAKYQQARQGKLAMQKKNKSKPATHQEIMQGLGKAKALWSLRDQVEEFIPKEPLATTWLNKMRWTADYALRDPPPAEVKEKAKENPFLKAVIGDDDE